MRRRRQSSGTRWHPRNDAHLRALWDRNATRATIEAAFPDRSWGAIVDRALVLGLPLVPPGWCSVSEAARRAGYDRRTFTRVLRALRVQARPHPRPSHRRDGIVWHPMRCVSWPVVERKLRSWLATQGETVSQAAVRLVVPRSSLARWARAEGMYETTTRGRAMRMPRRDWDRLVTRHMSGRMAA